MTTEERLLNLKAIHKSYTYMEYRNLMENLLERRKTTGEDHSEERLLYTRMNLFRMDRQVKYAHLNGELEKRLKTLKRRMVWLVLTEGWSSDSAQNLPIIHKMAESAPQVELKLLLRDEHYEVMDQIRRDGIPEISASRSMPILICLDRETHEVLGIWGPRPQTAQEISKNFDSITDISVNEAAERLHNWYADDNNREIQEEFLILLDQWDA